MTEIRRPKGLTEGLGGECIVPSGTVYQRTTEPLHPYFVGSITSASDIVSLANVINSQGTLQSAAIENATELFGYRIKAGSVLTGIYGSGLINFATPFTTANWFLTLSARDYGVPQFSRTGSCPAYGTSGLRRASGCWIVGGSSTAVDWIAVGI